MSRRIWTGLLGGLLAAMAVVVVGVGAFHAGENHSVAVERVIPGTDVPAIGGDTVRVVDYGHWRGGPPFGFLFPLLILGIVVLLFAGRRRAYWGRPYGPAWGGGPGWGGPCGPGGGAGGREAMLAEWHRQAHADGEPEPSGQP